MKKILVNLALFFAVIATYGQQPVHIYTPHLMAPGNWYMVGTWDSTNACYADTLGYYMEGDTVKIWSNKTLWINGNTIQPNLWKLTGNNLEPVISTNYINTDSAYRIKDRNILKAKGTNMALGYVAGDSSSAVSECTYIGYGAGYLNSANSFTGVGSGCGLQNSTEFFTGIGSRAGYGNTGDVFTGIGSDAGDGNTGDTCLFLGTQSGTSNALDNWLYIGRGDTNTSLINGYTGVIQRKRLRINGELNVSSKLTALKATVDTLEITSDYLLYEMPHCYFYKVDTAGYTLTLDQNVWKSLDIAGMTDAESHTINRSGDTIVYQGIKDAHILIDININGTTSAQNDDIWLRVYNVTAGIITDYDFRTSSGSGNYGRWGVNSYSTTCAPGEKYIIQMKNKTNGNDMTLYRVSILFKVLHYE